MSPSCPALLTIGRRAALSLTVALASAGVAHAGEAAPLPTFGQTIIVAGDVNGDGLQDYAGRGPDASGGRGPLQVVFATPGVGRAVWPTQGGDGIILTTGARMAVPARIGDFDGDGFDDVLLTDAGTHVVYGGPASAQLDVTAADPRVSTFDTSGTSVFGASGIGDFDGDGFSDVLLPNRSMAAQGIRAVDATIVRGRATRAATVAARAPGAGLIHVAGAQQCVWELQGGWLPFYRCTVLLTQLPVAVGDVNGDGNDDLYQPAGSFVIGGRAGATTISGVTHDAHAFAVASRPTSSPWDAPSPQPDPDPQPDPVPGEPLTPPSGGVVIGDVNGDGHRDFAKVAAASAQVAFGTAAGNGRWPADGGDGFVVDLTNAGGIASPFVRRLGDFDRDGFDDLAIFDGQGPTGIWVVYGAADSSTVRLASGGSRVTRLDHGGMASTTASAGIGDFDGDGFTDLMQVRPPANVLHMGIALIVHGRGDRPSRIDIFTGGAGKTYIGGTQRCRWVWVGWLPEQVCAWELRDTPLPIGDVDRDGKTDLYQPAGGFVIRGRASRSKIEGEVRNELTYTAARPTTDPWTMPAAGTPDPQPDPQPDPGTDPPEHGLQGWQVNGGAQTLHGEDAVNVLPASWGNYSGSVFDTRFTRDARRLTVEFDLELRTPSGVTQGGHGLALAFASSSLGGHPYPGGTGVTLGWSHNHGYAVLLGTVKGSLTPSDNYVAIANDVVGRGGYPTLLAHAPAGSPLKNNVSRIKVVSAGGTVTVSINGVERLRHAVSLPADAHLGFTASSSDFRQDHIVRNVVVTPG